MPNRYWLTPPELYAKLDAEFHFDFDPCPYPRPEGYNSLVLPWGISNYVNPPFCRKDAPHGGVSAFARKAIAEREDGKSSVIILPVPNSIGLLLEAGAEVRYAGKVKWMEAETGEPWSKAYRQGLFILRGKKGEIAK
ncbi:hypothetical protein FACS1894216_00930 [Synergistales bacterium]|nr:hypothetical protein FACS1894216_00930 [Synergistales bacterium]